MAQASMAANPALKETYVQLKTRMDKAVEDFRREMAATRTLLVSATNGSAVLCFAVAGAVRWPEMLAMMVSAITGGYYGARFARYLPPTVLRWFVVALSATVTVAFFLRTY